jgi:hypothetical protein
MPDEAKYVLNDDFRWQEGGIASLYTFGELWWGLGFPLLWGGPAHICFLDISFAPHLPRSLSDFLSMTSWLLNLAGSGAQLEDIETPHQSMLDLFEATMGCVAVTWGMRK